MDEKMKFNLESADEANMDFKPSLYDIKKITDKEIVKEDSTKMALFTHWILAEQNVLIAGPRSSGKCVSEDTEILLENGALKKVRDLKDISSTILTIDGNYKIKRSHFKIAPNDMKECFKIKTTLGREIEVSSNHPLMMFPNKWVSIDDGLKERDLIAIPRKIPNDFKGEIKDVEVKVLSYLIAEGGLTKGQVVFSNNDEKIVKELKDTASLFGYEVCKYDDKCTYFFKNVTKRYVRRRKTWRKEKTGKLGKLLKKHNLMYKKSTEKEIPEVVFKLKKEQLKLFLNRLFSCDGSIHKSKARDYYTWSITYSSSSERLIRQLQHLLLRFELNFILRKKTIKFNGKKFKTFELSINGIGVKQFIDKIGFFGEKEIKVEKYLSEEYNYYENRGKDKLPKEVWNIFYEELERNNTTIATLHKKIGMNKKQFWSMRRYSPTRSLISRIADIINSVELKNISNSDIYWDKIKEIKHVGSKNTYDLSVPETECFIANDILSHNTWITDHLAKYFLKNVFAITLGSAKSGWYQVEQVKNCSHIVIFELQQMPEDFMEILKLWGEGKEANYKVVNMVNGVRSVKNYKLPVRPYTFCLADEEEVKISEQLSSRLTVLRTDNSIEQNKTVMSEQAKNAMFKSPKNAIDENELEQYKKHISTMPYMDGLVFKHPAAEAFVNAVPAFFTDSRRDFPKYLNNTYGITRFYWKERIIKKLKNGKEIIFVTPQDMYMNHQIFWSALVDSALKCSALERCMIDVLKEEGKSMNRTQIQRKLRQKGINVSSHMVSRHMNQIADIGYAEKFKEKTIVSYAMGDLFNDFRFEINWKEVVEKSKENIQKEFPEIADEYIKRYCNNPTVIDVFSGEEINLNEQTIKHEPIKQEEQEEDEVLGLEDFGNNTVVEDIEGD